MTTLALDSAGYPILFGADLKDAPSAKPLPPSTRPAAVDHVEWARRQDAVREAAREFEDLKDQDIRERLRGLTSKPLATGELAQFRVDVRQQIIDDVVDVLDQRARGALRGRRTVRVTAPRGYMKKTMAKLDAGEVAQIKVRLKARGWDDKQLADLDGKLPDRLAEPEGAHITFAPAEVIADSSSMEATIAEVLASVQPPTINVTIPEQPDRPPRTAVPIRGDDGLIERVEWR